MFLSPKKGPAASNNGWRGKNMKGETANKTEAKEVAESPKQIRFKEKIAQLDFEDTVFKEVIAFFPKGKGLADSMWADPGTKPLVISSKNVFGMKKDYLQHPIQDEHKPSPPRLSAGSEAEKVKSCDISLDVSKSTFSHHIEVDYSLSTTLPSTPSKSSSMNTISLDYTKMAGYVPPHLKGLSVAKPGTPSVTEHVLPHLKSSLSPDSVAIGKTDYRVPLHQEASSSGNNTKSSKTFGNIPLDTSTASVTPTSKVDQYVSPHSKSPSENGFMKTLKSTSSKSPLIASGAKFAANPGPIAYVLPHLRVTKPTQDCSPSPLVSMGLNNSPSSINASVTAPLEVVDNVPLHLSKSNSEEVSSNSKISTSRNVPSEECKPMAPSLIPTTMSTGNDSTNSTCPTKVASASASDTTTSPQIACPQTTCPQTTCPQTTCPQPDFKLACTWEEFTRGKESRVTTHIKHSEVLAVKTTIDDDAALSISKYTPEKQNPSIDQSSTDHASTNTQSGQHTGRELAKQDKQSGINKPIETHTDIEVDIYPPEEKMKPGLLTRSALIKVAGSAPPESVVSGVEYAVSDDGVEGSSQPQDIKADPYDKKETRRDEATTNTRDNLAPRPIGLQEWRSSWETPWDSERNDSCSIFTPSYIVEWQKNIEGDDQKVDITADEFTTGMSPLCNKKFLSPIQHPESRPNMESSENRPKQREQHAEMDCKNFLRRQLRRKRLQDRSALLDAQRTAEIDAAYDSAIPEPNPHAPTIPIYLRPAEERDVPGITEIYNHYVLHSIIPEDQEPVDQRSIRVLLNDVQSDNLPFIVAILGTLPKDPSIHSKKFNSRYPTARSVAQSEERVVGFTYVNSYYGLSSTARGRSRFTGNLQFYVHHEYTRKGIGRSLVDRILLCTCSTHCGRGGYDWVAPKDPLQARIYGDGGGDGPRRYHQLLIERPIERGSDPDHQWLKRWLHQRFFFTEVARFLSTARSRVPEKCRWLDVVTFQKSATVEGEIMPCM